MPLTGQYDPSPDRWVRDQVETYERTGGLEGRLEPDTGLPVVIITTRGAKTGRLRKNPLMRVEHDGTYALIGSKSGSAQHPQWYRNLQADPTALMVQDGPSPFDAVAREPSESERHEWWLRAIQVFPRYEEYQDLTDRLIPVLLAEHATTVGHQPSNEFGPRAQDIADYVDAAEEGEEVGG